MPLDATEDEKRKAGILAAEHCIEHDCLDKLADICYALGLLDDPFAVDTSGPSITSARNRRDTARRKSTGKPPR